MKYRLITLIRIAKELYQLIITFSLQFVRFSFSQTGEDSIISELFSSKNKKTIFFVDIGAFHPWHLNNTARFYLNGSRGINIEPNYHQFKKFSQYRSGDINLNIGISDVSGSLDYFMFDNPIFNTFSLEQSIENEQRGLVKLKTLKVDVKTINDVLATYSKGQQIDFLTIDAEGIDFTILKSLDFFLYSPNVISIETSMNDKGIQGNSDEIATFIKEKGYLLYAHTPYNALFVNRKFWDAER